MILDTVNIYQHQHHVSGDAHCPRQNGVYPKQGECDTYYSCLNGKSSPTKCAPGLHYSDEIGTCVWPRESGRDDCDAAPPSSRRTQAPPTNTGVTTSKPVQTLSNGFRQVPFNSTSQWEGRWGRLDLPVIFIIFLKTPLWSAPEQLMTTLAPQGPVVTFWTME